MGFWGVVNNCIKNAELILLVVDARIPEKGINYEVIKKARLMKQEVIIVFNKSDLISERQKNELKKKYPKSFVVSNKLKKSVIYLRRFLEEKSEKKTLRVAILGYPNVGKSSLLNLLVPNAGLKISSVSGTTKKTKWIRYKNIRFMDSPGVIPITDSNVELGITASKDAHKIKYPEKVALKIIGYARKVDNNFLKRFYGIDFLEDDFDYDVFLKIGDVKKFRVRGGGIDENRTAVRIIDDWQKGKIDFS